MKIKDVTNYLESFAPLSIQENYDNSGLIVGDTNNDVSAILVTLDCTEEIVEEAINTYNFIISSSQNESKAYYELGVLFYNQMFYQV